MKKTPFFLLIPAIIFCFGFNKISSNPENDILNLVPKSNEVDTWRWIYDPEIYEGEDLFTLINGGADIYHEYGFKKVVSCVYENAEGVSINLELYEMLDSASAYGMYSFKTGSKGEKINIGDNALLEDYYLNLWKGNFVVTLIGFNSEQATIDGLLTLAGSIDKKIIMSAKTPKIVSLLKKENLQKSTYLKGILALYNNYVFDLKNIFGVTKGVLGDYGEYRIFIFQYQNSAEQQKWFDNAQNSMQQNPNFSRFNLFENEFQTTDREGFLVHVLSYQNYTLIAISKEDIAHDVIFEEIKAKISMQ